MAQVLITGGASGLGLGCARAFLNRGDRVTLADIDEEGGARALQALDAGHHARFEPVDLADSTSIAMLVGRLRARGKPFDILVNNAGIYPPSQRTLSTEGNELCFAITYIGHFRLTRALSPLLVAAGPARVISVSSLVQRRAQLFLDDLNLAQDYTPIKAYAQAKLACLMFAIEFQRRLTAVGSPIRSYAAHPGVVRTQLGRNRPTADSDSAMQRMATASLGGLLSRFGQTPEAGAAAIIEATTTELPGGSLIGPTGFLEMSGTPGLIQPGPAAADAKLCAALWQRTEQLTEGTWTL